MQCHSQTFLITCSRNFKHLLQYKLSIKCFLSIHVLLFLFFFLFFCSITRIYGIFHPAFYFIPNRLCAPLHLLEDCRSDREIPCISPKNMLLHYFFHNSLHSYTSIFIRWNCTKFNVRTIIRMKMSQFKIGLFFYFFLFLFF